MNLVLFCFVVFLIHLDLHGAELVPELFRGGVCNKLTNGNRRVHPGTVTPHEDEPSCDP